MKEIHVDKVNLLVIDELISTSDNRHQWFSIYPVGVLKHPYYSPQILKKKDVVQGIGDAPTAQSASFFQPPSSNHQAF